MTSPNYQGKRVTPRMAIRTFCRWCNGGSPTTCVSPTCPLYAYRTPQVMPGNKLSPLRSIRARCIECAGTLESVLTCSAYKPFSEAQPECPLWPHRGGKRHVSVEYRAERRLQAKDQRKNPGAEAGFVSVQLTLSNREE